MGGPDDVPPEILARLRPVCLALPETYEEPAWVGVRWRIRRRTFAHVLTIEDGRPAAHARAADTDGPATVLIFRSAGTELAALTAIGHPWFTPSWGPDVVGLVLQDRTDDAELAELLTESYRLLASKTLAARLDPP
ncbi:MAG: MmcQ/YjbR family DNA-binding protein [Pseudonocardia sp.]|nr:MmcQ/YjbR family DNA-binding protein [Pseudonocardia sp.]